MATSAKSRPARVLGLFRPLFANLSKVPTLQIRHAFAHEFRVVEMTAPLLSHALNHAQMKAIGIEARPG
jgi:hypothetical protein